MSGLKRLICCLLATFLLMSGVSCGQVMRHNSGATETFIQKIDETEPDVYITKNANEIVIPDWTYYERLRAFTDEVSGEVLLNSGPAAGHANRLYSPTGLYYTLGHLAAGTKGAAKSELDSFLKIADDAAFQKYNSALPQALKTANEYGETELAASLWFDSGKVVPQDSFIERFKDMPECEVLQRDFANPQTAEEMSRWVSERTRQMILPKIENHPDTVMQLLSALYYSCEWVDRFAESENREDMFTTFDGSQVAATYMTCRYSSHHFVRGQNFTASSLPLKNGSMTFVLPDEGVTVEDLLRDPGLWAKVRGDDPGVQSGSGEVIWEVPKFQTNCHLSLKEHLQALGLNSIFTPEADFSEMIESVEGPAFFVGAVDQDAGLEIDENGVVAAAFTKVDFCGAAQPEGRAEMILNRPFLYVLESGNAPLMVGVLETPAQ